MREPRSTWRSADGAAGALVIARDLVNAAGVAWEPGWLRVELRDGETR